MNGNEISLESAVRPSEAVIIGGSAAGLFAAYLLARDGVRVRLFDANDVLRTSPRTLIATSQLTEILGFFPSDAVINRINRIDLFSPHRSATIPMAEPDLVVERATIVRLLAERAIQAGAEIQSGTKFLNFAPAEGGVTVKVRNLKLDQTEEFKTTTLIGADGAFSRVAKVAERNSRATVPILQAIVRLPSGMQADITQVWFDPETTPYFYWLIPESQDRGAVGLIAEDSSNAKENLERFLARRGLEAIEIQAAKISVYTHTPLPWRRVSDCDIYLVGDAAGQVKVTTVGGLVSGLWGAKAAAKAILGQGNYGKEIGPLRRELGLHLLLRSILNRLSGGDYDRLLELLDGKTTHLLGRYTRDELAKMFLRLLVTQPRLLSFAARLLLPRGVPGRVKRFLRFL
ncbi:MAG: FAD-dependent monooxygenase [Candidatus Binatia bacterium]